MATVVCQPIKKLYFSILTRNGVVEKYSDAPPLGEEHTLKTVGKTALFQNGGNPGGNIPPDLLARFSDQLIADAFTQEQADRILATLQDCMALNQ